MTAVYKIWKDNSGVVRGQVEMLKSKIDGQASIDVETSYTSNGNMVTVKNMSKIDAKVLVRFVKGTWNSVYVSVNTKNGTVIVDIFDLEDVKDTQEGKMRAVIRDEIKNTEVTMVSVLYEAQEIACKKMRCGECPFYFGHCFAGKYLYIKHKIPPKDENITTQD